MRYLLLIASIVILFCLDVALRGAELPCPMRIPTPMFQTDDCDCDGCCCCAAVCKCVSLPYDLAIKKAEDEQKPIVVFLNCKAHYVEGCVSCRVKSFPGASFNIGVIVGAPLSWEGQEKGFRVLAEIYGPANAKKVLEFVNYHKDRCKKQRSDLQFIKEVMCGPIG